MIVDVAPGNMWSAEVDRKVEALSPSDPWDILENMKEVFTVELAPVRKR